MRFGEKMGREQDSLGGFHRVIKNVWFRGVSHPSVDLLVEEIDKSIDTGDMDKAVSLMKAVDDLGGRIPLEGVEKLNKEVPSEDGGVDKGRKPALHGETRSMDISGNETKSGQKRKQVRKVEGGWVPQGKPAPHDSIVSEDTFLSKEGRS